MNILLSKLCLSFRCSRYLDRIKFEESRSYNRLNEIFHIILQILRRRLHDDPSFFLVGNLALSDILKAAVVLPITVTHLLIGKISIAYYWNLMELQTQTF